MKSNFLMITAMFMFFCIGTTSCSDDDEGGSAGTAASGTVTAKVDGANFQSNEMLSSGNLVTQGPTDSMTLQGTDNSGKGFNFVINGYDGVGTYTFGGSSLGFIVGNYIEANASNPTASQTWTAPYDDDSIRGEINISTDSGDNVTGTFEFTAKNSNGDGSIKTITEGSFDLDYTTF
jgi:hypothetical protein